jgi:hypothetical protein
LGLAAVEGDQKIFSIHQQVAEAEEWAGSVEAVAEVVAIISDPMAEVALAVSVGDMV